MACVDTEGDSQIQASTREGQKDLEMVHDEGPGTDRQIREDRWMDGWMESQSRKMCAFSDSGQK